MTTQQPRWRMVANLGDVHPLEYGGFFVFTDETGVYAPEAELLIEPENEDGTYTVYRFRLEACTFENGILSDNKFHKDHAAWFATPEAERATRPQDTTYLSNVASSVGQTVEELVTAFCSDNPLVRAHAWRAVGDYHGFENLDSYPLTLTRREAKKRYAGLVEVAPE